MLVLMLKERLASRRDISAFPTARHSMLRGRMLESKGVRDLMAAFCPRNPKSSTSVKTDMAHTDLIISKASLRWRSLESAWFFRDSGLWILDTG